jgi:hypothetical protein
MVEGTQSGSGLENRGGKNEPMSSLVHYLSRRTPTGKTRLRVHQERIARCRTGPMPHPHVTMEEVEDEEDEEDLFTHHDLPDLQEDSDNEEEEEDEQLEKGTRNTEDIQAGGNFSQRLAEAAHKNEKKKDFQDAVPDYLHDFQDIFTEESWSPLPERKIWDHAIELTEDAKVSNCKVYPMSRSEQTELDAYIDEHLLTGHIRPSKSLMASLCFFIKKKDGKLCFIQDYRNDGKEPISTSTHPRTS